MICVMFSSTALIRYSSAPYTSQIAWTALHCWEMLWAIFHCFVLYVVVSQGSTQFCTVLHPRNRLSSSAQYGTECALVAAGKCPVQFTILHVLHCSSLFCTVLHSYTLVCTVLHPRNRLSFSAQFGTKCVLVADLIADLTPQNFPFNVAQILYLLPQYFSLFFVWIL